jgi:hypothetical protein
MMNHDQRTVLKMVLAGDLSAAFQQNCTLKPMDGSKRSALSGGVNGKMTLSACTSIVHDFVFEWPRKQGLPGTPQEALKRAASLLRERRKARRRVRAHSAILR